MRIRDVRQELEVQLKPAPGSLQAGAHGKAEWKTYADGRASAGYRSPG